MESQASFNEVLLLKIDELIAINRRATMRDPMLSAQEVAAYFGVHNATLYATILCKPSFPKPIIAGGGHKRWRESEVSEWANAQREPERKRGRRKSLL